MKRCFIAVVLAALAAVLAASPALAHQGNPNFRSELDGIKPAVAGLDVQVLNYDDSLQLQNETGKTVIVYGYEHDPYIRIAGDGTVAVNTRSPAYYLNDDRFGNAEVPATADASASPEWQVIDKTSQYVWHDHRIHYMDTGTPPAVTDPDKKTKVFDYHVPIQVGAERAAITGTLYWVGEPGGFPILPFAILGGLTLVGVVLVIRRRRRDREPAEVAEAW